MCERMEYISKGKAHKRYELGTKLVFVVPNRSKPMIMLGLSGYKIFDFQWFRVYIHLAYGVTC